MMKLDNSLERNTLIVSTPIWICNLSKLSVTKFKDSNLCKAVRLKSKDVLVVNHPDPLVAWKTSWSICWQEYEIPDGTRSWLKPETATPENLPTIYL